MVSGIANSKTQLVPTSEAMSEYEDEFIHRLLRKRKVHAKLFDMSPVLLLKDHL